MGSPIMRRIQGQSPPVFSRVPLVFLDQEFGVRWGARFSVRWWGPFRGIIKLVWLFGFMDQKGLKDLRDERTFMESRHSLPHTRWSHELSFQDSCMSSVRHYRDGRKFVSFGDGDFI